MAEKEDQVVKLEFDKNRLKDEVKQWNFDYE